MLKSRLLLVLLATALAGAPVRPAVADAVREPDIPAGAGLFEAASPQGRAIEVFSYRAAGHGADDPVVIVLAGGGRNGDDYRDSWARAAECYSLLVLAPVFDEARFPGPISYNLAGMIRDGAEISTLRRVELTPPETWLFGSIEAVFDEAVARTGSRQTRYDLFGHSAGGQIVHRMMMFAPHARVRTGVAANSGWYTTPSPDAPFPYGLGGLPLASGQLETSFQRDLVLLLGELDNETESRGHLRETEEAMAQGAHRLERGRHFHAIARAASARLGVPLRWRLQVVPGVGHAYREMSAAAAVYLYGRPEGGALAESQTGPGAAPGCPEGWRDGTRQVQAAG